MLLKIQIESESQPFSVFTYRYTLSLMLLKIQIESESQPRSVRRRIEKVVAYAPKNTN